MNIFIKSVLIKAANPFSPFIKEISQYNLEDQIL